MKCLILAAGYATRMYPLTKDIPKALLKINELTILDYLMDNIEQKAYIDEFIIITNDRFYNQFKDFINTRKENISLINNYSTSNENRLGAVKDIKIAIDTKKISTDLLIVASDNLLDFSINDFIQYYYTNEKTTSVMRYFENSKEKLSKTGVITITKDNRVQKMYEKPKEYVSSWAVPPFYIINPNDLIYINEALKDNINPDSPGNLIEYLVKKTDVLAYLMPGKRYDIGSLEDYEALSKK